VISFGIEFKNKPTHSPSEAISASANEEMSCNC